MSKQVYDSFTPKERRAFMRLERKKTKLSEMQNLLSVFNNIPTLPAIAVAAVAIMGYKARKNIDGALLGILGLELARTPGGFGFPASQVAGIAILTGLGLFAFIDVEKELGPERQRSRLMETIEKWGRVPGI